MKKLIFVLGSCLSTVCIYGVDDYFFGYNNQRAREYVMRVDAALRSTLEQPNYDITTENNGEATAANLFFAAHTKSFEHDGTTGLLTPFGVQNYQQLVTAINANFPKQAPFNAVSRVPNSGKFVNPQAGNMLTLEGVPNNLIPLPLFPLLSTPQAAALIIELYLQAICRSVFFADYGTGVGTDADLLHGGSITANAAAILTALGPAYTGPTIGGVVTPGLLFKIAGFDALVGPYVSQFLYLSVPIEFQPTRQFLPLVDIASPKEFGVSFADFIAIQDGLTPAPYPPNNFSGTRYIVDGRDLTTLVHGDGPGEIYFYTANILLKNNFPRSPVLPYFNGTMPNEAAFVGMAITDIYGALFGATLECLKHAWAHKWRGDRVLRPDAFGGLVQRVQVTGMNPFNLDQSIFATYGTSAGPINLLAWVKSYNMIQQTNTVLNPLTPPAAETFLLSQMYPEGSPVHPSYPAGHAVYSGACITILKAFFNDQAFIKDHVVPVKPDPNNPTQLVPLPAAEGANELTVGGELNKQAYDIAMGRNSAGIHYRVDGLQGILLGEQVALNYLRDHARFYNEQNFIGFELTTFSGQRVRITADAIINI